MLSRRQAGSYVWQASQFEFEDVIAQVDDVLLLTPDAQPAGPARAVLHGAANRARKALGRPRRSALRPPSATIDAELFFAVFAHPHEIGALPHVRDQLARSRVKVAFIVELWTTEVDGVADYLRQLRGFDHIFLFSRGAIPAVERITGVPCTYLPTAVDTALFAPPTPDGARCIDVSSYGRRLPETHDALLDAMAAGDIYYHYDTVHGAFQVTGHREHRAALAAMLRRSRYSVVYRNNDDPGRTARTGGEESLTNRYFEVLAAGAVMLGSAAETSDFEDCFGWTDAVVPLRAPAPDVMTVIETVERDGDRRDRASRAGIVECLRRHDWAHRWRDVLAVAGVPERPQLGRRLDELEALARRHEASPT
ncbi:glycosyltransferase [Actinotalea sp. C106]|uniref:glycosyltransferase family protein n=1 Tax=Actinotalea sp. C106 TaxID=2908644 RepID=UPI002028994F|nr:glycosyltransferase [Actinotalea sp. C106]